MVAGQVDWLSGQTSTHFHERERLAVRLFIGNLPYDATETELRGHFAAVGAPLQVLVPVDRDTGRPRGFAFVEFAEREVAEEIIRRFNGQPFKGRPLAVSEARAREDRGPGPRAGGFAPRPIRPPAGESGAPRDRPSAGWFSAPARRQRTPLNRRSRPEKGPKGPIRERAGGRVFDVDDNSPDVDLDFDNFATRSDAPVDVEDEQE
jgi:RNA recognition motif-containing protein